MNDLEKIREAIEFLGLNEDFTLEEVRKIKGFYAKKYHPDNHGETLEEKEQLDDKLGIIFGHCSTLMSYAKLHKMEIDEKFKNEGSEFRKKIVSDKLKYKQESVTQLVNKYMISLNNIVGFAELRKLRREYEIELNKVLDNLKKAEDFNLEVKKKSWARAFKYKFDKTWSSKNNMEETVRKTKTFLTILELIQNAKKDNIDSLISKLGYVEFNDYEHDVDIIKNIMNEFTLYINIETGSYAFVDRIDKDDVYYRKQLSDELTKGSTKKFLQLHISLEEFLRKAVYVGKREVALYKVTTNGKEFIRGDSNDAIIGRYLYYEYDSELMLMYKQSEPFENFIFCATPRSPNINVRYQFEFANLPKKEEPENGKYRDRQVVYDKLITQIKNNKLRREKTEKMGSSIKR